MNGPGDIGRFLIIGGIILIGMGIVFAIMGKVHWFGRLPGDIVIKKKNFSLYFPVMTCIVISIIFSLILMLFSRR